MEKKNTKIIAALDLPTGVEALKAAETLREEIEWFKVGLQLFCAEGPGLVRELRQQGCRVFLDLKLHDIPNTVARAVESIARLEVEMTTLHLGGGPEMAAAAVKAAQGADTQLLGVTVLTSSTAETLQSVGVGGPPEDQVLRLARLGTENGITGLVASPREIALLRQVFGREPTLVIPGIRPAGSASDDQRRTMTPGEAAKAGADYLVIGRPILAADNPLEAACRIRAEVEGRTYGE